MNMRVLGTSHWLLNLRQSLSIDRHVFLLDRKITYITCGYRKVRCITRDNVQDAPPKVEEKTWKKPQVH